MPSSTLGLLFGVWVFQQQAQWCAWWILALAALGLGLVTGWRLGSGKSCRPAWLKPWFKRGLLFCWLCWLGFAMAQARAQWRLSETLQPACQQRPLQVQVLITGLPAVDALGQHVDARIERVYTAQCQLGSEVPTQVRLHLYQGRFAAEGRAPSHAVGLPLEKQQASPPLANHTQPALPLPNLTNTPPNALQSMAAKPASAKVRFTAGSRWRLTVKLKRPHATRNPHGFDYAAWCLAHHIQAMGSVVQKAPMQQITPFVWRVDTVINRIRSQVGARIEQVLGHTPESAVIRALVIGDDSQLKRADWQLFIDSGINHLISISGLHITMLAAIGYWMVQRCWRIYPLLGIWLPSRLAASLGGVWVAVAYSALAGFSIPTQRTLWMLITIAILRNLKRPLPLIWILSAALWVVVWFDPWSVMAPGFWLSFGAVACLSFAMGGRIGAHQSWRAAIYAQWVMTIGMLPVLIGLFNQLSLVSPVTNALAIPLVSMLIVPLALLGALLPIDSALWLAATLMHGLFAFLQACHTAWMSVWYFHTPPTWAVVCAMLGVVVCLMPRGWPLRMAGLAGCLPLLLPQQPALQAGHMRVHVLDVGQGLSVLVQTAQHQLLYDAGPRYGSDSDAGQRIVLPYLRHLGVHQLEMVVISHDDNDHVGGMASVLNHMHTRQLLTSLPAEANFFSDWHSPFKSKTRVSACRVGQQWEWDQVRFQMLSPPPSMLQTAKDNDKSCVLKVQAKHGSLLLTGDIEQQAEAWLVANQPKQLASDVITMPHHGSKTSSSLAFVQATQPMVAIATMGHLNRFGHPKPDVIARYQRQGSRVLRSDWHGAVIVDFLDDQRPHVTTWRQAEPHYWEHTPTP